MTASSLTPRSEVVAPADERPLKELWSEMGREASALLRKEVELAKVELKDAASKAGQASAMFGGTGVAALIAVQALSVALGFGLAAVMPAWAAALIVAVVWLVAAAACLARGRRSLAEMKPVPEQTLRTIKDDVKIAKQSLSRGASKPYDGRWSAARR